MKYSTKPATYFVSTHAHIVKKPKNANRNAVEHNPSNNTICTKYKVEQIEGSITD